MNFLFAVFALVKSLLSLLFLFFRTSEPRSRTEVTGNGNGNGYGEDSIYNLGHAVLNLDQPPRSMWMNMGYWRVCIPAKEPCDEYGV